MALEQGAAIFFFSIKGQRVNISVIVGYTTSAATPGICHGSTKAPTDDTKMDMAVSYKTLCAKRGGFCPNLFTGRWLLVIGDWGQ